QDSFNMSRRRTVDMISMSARMIHETTLEMLGQGVPMIQVRARWESITLRTLDLTREIISTIKSTGDSSHSDRQYIPELEEIIAISKRTIDLCRPPAA
ncbi:hypothetical protein PMAYCL1PPCAC_00055, partial [Pristionchus mayeri]